LVLEFYRFLRINTPTIAIAIMIAIMPATKNVTKSLMVTPAACVAAGGVVVAVGAAVTVANVDAVE
jgi:hypothetical protein